MAKWKNNLMTCKVVNCTLYHFLDHVKMDMASLAISDCLMKVVKYIAPY